MAYALDPYRLPLRGCRLIEASAGTGKTWTIASLYLRLVLGHGSAGPDGSAFQRPLAPAEILVMTFTRAATRDLSDRIRARLIEAASCFRGEAKPDDDDRFLAALLADYGDAQARAEAAWRMAIAAETMDESAVLTIDAWCQRMLGGHAFDTGNPFDETLLADDRALLGEAVRDYWRQHCYPLAGERLERALDLWPSVAALHADVEQLVRESLPRPARSESLAQCIDRSFDANRQARNTLAAGWGERARSIKAWLDEQFAVNKAHWDSKLQSRHYGPWLERLANWERDPYGTPFDSKPSLTERRLTPASLLEARSPGAPALKLPDAFAALTRLRVELERLRPPQTELRIHAVAHIADRLTLLKKEARSFSFADIAARLERALAGAHGERLRSHILDQHPVALIDEFQDTSPQQYRLFDAIYRCAEDGPGTALLLIGDPKQSIYRFRGADIYSYLRARRATEGRLYALDTNRRSSAAMVEAVNTVFRRAEARPEATDCEPAGGRPTDLSPTDLSPTGLATAGRRRGAGAFLFRSAAGNPVPFEPVHAKGRSERFVTAAGPVTALTVQHDLHLHSQRGSVRRFAERCAQRIVTWLNDESAGFDDSGKRFVRLRPADIAVLVRTGAEADAVRRALGRRSVASVYLSERDSVFASDEAHDLLRWLRAVASPADTRLVRAALATRTIGLPIAELARLADDDLAFDACSDRMRMLHTVWNERGVLTMLRRSLHAFDLPARWLAQPDGERRLTNVLHLAELLQQASVELDGEQALLRWLASRIDEGSETRTDEHLLRLESDADLIRVVTIHKSKGLEYPVVCLPFACGLRRVTRRFSSFLALVDDAGERQIKLDFDDDDLDCADFERLREDLRLFYVALTRARHAVWMGFGALRIGNSAQCVTHLSAPGCLLGDRNPRSGPDWLEPLAALAADAQTPAGPCIEIEAAPDRVDCTRLMRAEVAAPLREIAPYSADFERYWSPGSYSLLVRDADGAALAPAQVRRRAEDEGQAPGGFENPERGRGALASWHRFPGGTATGNFIHGLLEWLDGKGFALTGSTALQTMLLRRCERAGHGDRYREALDWVEALLETPLPSLDATLPELGNRLPEMEFWMPAAHLQAESVDALCQLHLLGGTPRPALPARQLNGMLMGFADLVFEHQGRYWVLDYKTNRLGPDALAYDRAMLEAEMARHRYDVQAAVYLLALHRLLRARLGSAYDASRQLGGALYWFVRGIDGPVRGEYAMPCSGDLLTLIDDLDRLLVDEDAA